jgi:hypothetical protein
MSTPKVNSWLGWWNLTVNISPMLKPCSSSSKPLMDIIIALHCLNLALDHTWNIILSKFNLLKFHKVLAFISTEGRLLIKLIQVLTCSQSSSRSQKFWNKERDEEELNQVHKFKSPFILLMNSHLTLSLKPIYSTPFPLITYICGRLYMELWESLVLPRFINEMLSKQDKLLMILPRLVKKVIGK